MSQRCATLRRICEGETEWRSAVDSNFSSRWEVGPAALLDPHEFNKEVIGTR
jgi:hypothetical protein